MSESAREEATNGSVVERQREEQQALQALAGSDSAGLLLVGTGGVGKSTLAARVLRRLGGEGRIVMSVRGPTSPDEILAEIGGRLLEKALEFGLPEDDPNHRLAADVRRPDLDWTERFERLSTRLFGAMPLLFLLDDFDENLVRAEDGVEFASGELADLLGRWIAAPGRTRLAVTSRYEFSLAGGDPPALTTVELGLPTRDEAMALANRLPALTELKDDERVRMCTAFGGRPLALRFADALKRHGDLDLSEIESSSEPADRLLLRRLLDPLGEGTVARRLLVGASVYRQPVDDVALLWQVGEETEVDPSLAEKVRRFHETIEAAGSAGKNPTPAELGMTDEEFVDALSDLETWMSPPLAVPQNFAAAKEQLRRMGLLVARTDGETTRWAVERWTADLLADLGGEDELREAHRRAARNWRFRVQRTTEDVAEALGQLLESRFHFQRAGALTEAVEATERVCDQLEAWGAHRRIQELCREALAWSDEPSRQRAALLLQLGLAQERRGSLEPARTAYERALDMAQVLGDRPVVAGACHQLGRVAQARGDHRQAARWYRKSLALSEELGLVPGAAATISQLGALETERGEPEAGMRMNLQSLALRLQLGSDEAGGDVHWLHRQREALGAERFDELLQQEAGAEGARNVRVLLDQLAAAAGT